MTNSSCKIGNRTKAARRIAGMLISGTIAGTMAVGSAGMVHVAAATWQENANYIFEYLTQELGYTEAAACGIMANIRCESTFNPHAWNAGGGSYGLCQWTGGRYGRLRSWCGSNGYDYTTIEGQLAYLEYELQNHYPGVEEYLRSVENTSDGAYNAGQYYCYHFEAPASRGSVSVYRGGLASGTFWESYRPAEWYQVDGLWHYILRDGSYQTEWLTIEDETFYFDENGNRISGWRTIDGSRYFFGEDGVMATGWRKIDGRSYYFDSDGSLITGLVHNNDDWYLVDGSGNVQASADLEAFAPEWTAAEAEREAALASAVQETSPDQNPDAHTETQPEQLAAAEEISDTHPEQLAAAEEISDTHPEQLAAAEKTPDGSLTADSAAQNGEENNVDLPAFAAADEEDKTEEEEAANLSAIAAAENDPAEPDEGEDSYLAAAEAMQSAAMQQEDVLDGKEAEEAGEEPAASGDLLAALPSSVLEMAGPLPALSNDLFEGETPPALPSSIEAETSVADNADSGQEDGIDSAPEAEDQPTVLASADSKDSDSGEEQKETANTGEAQKETVNTGEEQKETAAAGEAQKETVNTGEEQKETTNTAEEQEVNAPAGDPSFKLPSSVLEMAGPLPDLTNDLFEGENLPELPPSVETETSVADNEDGEQEEAKDPAPETEDQTSSPAFADTESIFDGIRKETGLPGDKENLKDKIISGLMENENGESRDNRAETGKAADIRTEDRDDNDKAIDFLKKTPEENDSESREEKDSEGRENKESENREESLEGREEKESERAEDNSEAGESDRAEDNSEAGESDRTEDNSEAGESDRTEDDSEAGESESAEDDSKAGESERAEDDSADRKSENAEGNSADEESGEPENIEEVSVENDSVNRQENAEEKASDNKEFQNQESDHKGSENKEEESEEKNSGNKEENSAGTASGTSDSGDEKEAPDSRESGKEKDTEPGSETEDSNRIVVTIENPEDEEEEKSEEKSENTEDSGSFFSDMEDARQKILGENGDGQANEKIILMLDEDRLPAFTEKDLEDPDSLVEELCEEKILRAASVTGLDLTPEVTASVERSEQVYGTDEKYTYTITFSVEFDGESAEVSTEVTVEAGTQ